VIRRKTSPKVKDGRVVPKNRWSPTRAIAEAFAGRAVPDGPSLVVHREHPGRSYRHLVDEWDVRLFVALLDDWPDLSQQLRGVLLAAGDEHCQGWYSGGVIGLAAWSRDLAQEWDKPFVDEHAVVLDRLDVPTEPCEQDSVLCRFDEASARGFLLMHVLLHELGHHRDRLDTRRRVDSPRGEPFAEAYANERAEALWPAYHRAFARR
jgi:hypothetical protein